MSTSSPNRTDGEQTSPIGITIKNSDDISEEELIAAIASRREEPIGKVETEIKPILDKFDIDEIIAQQTNDIWF